MLSSVVLQRRLNNCFIQSIRHSIQHVIQTLNRLCHPTFTESHVALLLPTMTTLLQQVVRSVEGLEIAMTRSDNEHKQTIVHEQMIALQAQLLNKPPLDFAAVSQAAREGVLPDVLNKLDAVQRLLSGSAPSAHVMEMQASETGQDVRTSISDLVLAPDDLDLSTATRAEDSVLSTAPAAETPHAGLDDPAMQSSAEIAVGPAVPEPIQDMDLCANRGSSPSINAHPDVDEPGDCDRANPEAVDTDR